MTAPSFLDLPNEAAYRSHYEASLSRQTIHTFDGIPVRFPKWQFDHAFFESADRRLGDKSVFSIERARHMDWIVPALAELNAELYEGWERRKKAHTRDSRTCVAFGDYVVIIRLRGGGKPASFITAYQAGQRTLQRIRSGPKW